MTSLVALSFSAAVPGPLRCELTDAAARALAAHAGRPACVLAATGDEHVVTSDQTGGLAADRFVAALSRDPSVGLGMELPPGCQALALLGSDDILTRLGAPFAACWRAGADRPLTAATDTLGERHLYWWQGTTWAALATSSLVLGRITAARLDERALGAVALVGYHIGLQSSFQGVRKLGPGQRCTLRAGRIDVTSYAASDAVPENYGSFGAAVEAGHSVVSGLVEGAREATADAAMELSGGMDSRAILAAIPPSRRVGMAAYTLGPESSADVQIARRLARRWRMDHRHVDTEGLADLSAAEAVDLVERAGRRHDFGRDPVASGVLHWAEAQLDQGPRFTGLNGEFARGMWYPGQRSHPQVTPTLIDRLVSWRMFVNDAADRSILAPGFLADARSGALLTLRSSLATYDGDWLRACDELYVRQRMHRWAGSELSAACTDRHVLAPFLHSDWIEWARRTPPAFKRNGRAFAAVIERLDADLGRLPLDSGLSPRDLAHPGVAARVKLIDQFRRKAARKLRQRVRPSSKSEVGAPLLSALVLRGWRAGGALDQVARLSFINSNALDEIATGQRTVDAATVGFLAGLQGTLAFVTA